jgi:hypothetical protein
MLRNAALAFALILAGLMALGVYRAFAEGPAGAGPPFTHDLTFENDTPFPASSFSTTLSAYTYQVDLLEQPPFCLGDPDIDTGFGFSINVTWAAPCVRPGESVTLRLHGECDDCPPPDTEPSWGYLGLGDANCDAVTDPVDAALVLQFNAGLITDVLCDYNADFNGDGALSAVDAALILQRAANLFVL